MTSKRPQQELQLREDEIAKARKALACGAPPGASNAPSPNSDIEIATTWDDEDFAFVGRDPSRSIGNDAVLIPNISSALPAILRPRILIRLCGYQQDDNTVTEIRGIRLLSTIGFLDGAAPLGRIVREIPVETPGWNFSDGNISFHLRVEKSIKTRSTYVTAQGYPRGWSPTIAGVGSAVVFDRNLTSNTTPLVTYQPANGGFPPGQPLGHLGTIRNNAEFPWYLGNNSNLSYRISGMAEVSLWASVLLSNPLTRPAMPVIAPGFGDPREDIYVSKYPLTNFRHVAGAIRYRKLSRKL